MRIVAQKEIRATITDPNAVAERLIEDVGARELDIVEQHDTYFGLIDLYEKLGRFFLIRVREEDSRVMINYKSEVDEDIWEEYETIINSPEEAKKMFGHMGLEKVLEVRKKRRSYRFDGMHFNIDSIDGLGHFVEVKMDLEETTEERVYEVLRDAGVDEDQLISEGYVTQLLREKDSPYAEWCST